MATKLLLIGAGASYGARPNGNAPPMGSTLTHYLLGEMERTPQEDLKKLFSNPMSDFATAREIRRFLSSNKGRPYEQVINEYLARPEGKRPHTEEFLFGLNRLIAFSMRGDLPDWLVEEKELSARPPPEFSTGEDLYDVLVDRLALDASWVVISLNYDILVEQALERNGRAFHYFALEQGAGIEILKPHGSVNWFPNDANQGSCDGSEPEPSRFDITDNHGKRPLCLNSQDTDAEQSVMVGLFGHEAVHEPVLAHFCRDKPMTSNSNTLNRVRERCLSQIERIGEAKIIGVNPVGPEDDTIVHEVLERLHRIGRAVEYINPDPVACGKVKKFGFSISERRLQEWLQTQEGLMERNLT